MLKGFRDFVLRGKVVDLAVGVVMGAAFGTVVVSAFVKDLLAPIIAALVQKPDCSGLFFEVKGAKFLFGDFVNATISFLLVAAAVYFFGVLPINTPMKRISKQTLPDKKKCPECKSDVALINYPSAFTAQFNAGLTFPAYKNFGFSLPTQDNYLNNPSSGYKNNTFQFADGPNYSFKRVV